MLRSSSSSLELAIEPLLLVRGLEATVPELGRGVDELELDRSSLAILKL